MPVLSVGIDDTDSVSGMCTTYLGFKLARMLRRSGAEFLDYPRLVRLNPNIPWKTRGNGAVGLEIRTARPERARDMAIRLVERESETGHGANPAVVFAEHIPGELRDFSRLALRRLVPRGLAKKLVRAHGLDSFHVGNGQGLVGAAAVLGYEFGDTTMELLSYRRRRNFGTRRRISADSVAQMQKATFPHTFGSYDEDRRRVMIAPRGPDPVFCGIRGEGPSVLLGAYAMISTPESLDGYMLFRSNQGTADHLRTELDARDLPAYASGTVTGTICREPRAGPGGHVSFAVRAGGVIVPCMAYKESGFPAELADLCAGDRVTVGGGVRRAAKNLPRVVNAELVDVLHLAARPRTANPPCVPCNKRMKSMGRGQGFRCARCGARSDTRQTYMLPRRLRRGLYLPAASSQRHLARPYQRQGRTNRIAFDASVPWLG